MKNILVFLFLIICTILRSQSYTIYNPYDNADFDYTDKSNLHVHTDQSDGLRTVDYIVNLYASNGYSILAITDHDSYPLGTDPAPTWPWTDFITATPTIIYTNSDGQSAAWYPTLGTSGMLAIIGNELTGGGDDAQHVTNYFCHLGMSTYPPNKIYSYMDSIVNHGGLGIIAHPKNSSQDLPVEYLRGIFDTYSKDYLAGMDVYNSRGEYECLSKWDSVNMVRQPNDLIWGFGNDDYHASYPQRVFNFHYGIETLTEESVRDNIKTGSFAFCHEYIGGTVESPLITGVSVVGTTITITGTRYDSIKWVDNTHTYIASTASIDVSTLTNGTNFVRAELYNSYGTTYTQPFGIGANHRYYVSTTGNDSNEGTISEPWYSWEKALTSAHPGDTVYFRGGVWYPTAKSTSATYRNCVAALDPDIGLGYSGTEDSLICFFNYPGETPILDCSNVTSIDNFITGVAIFNARYLSFKGLTVRNVKQDRDYVEVFGLHATLSSALRFENMTIHHIDGNALRLSDMGYYYTGMVDTSYIINCDSYSCCDSLPRNISETSLGGAADGIKFYANKWSTVVIDGCRAWNCSDDGFDIGNAKAIIQNSWSFNNGYFDGDGTGFKTGGLLYDYGDTITRKVYNCIAAKNSADGFFLLEYEGYYRTNARFYNNSSYANGTYGYRPSRNDNYETVLVQYRNNISYADTLAPFSNSYQVYTESNNTWEYTTGYPGYISNSNYTVTDDDFVSLDVDELSGARKSDGSLPDVDFMTLAVNSELIDGGYDVGFPYNGIAPDLGWKEYAPESSTGDSIIITSSQMLADSLANNRQSGDVLYLAFGTLTDTFDIEVNGLTLRPYTGYYPHVPKFNVIADSINIHNMSIGSLNITGDYIFVDSDTLSNSTYAIRSTNNKHITIRNCEFENNDTTLIVNRVANLTFRNNTISGDGEAIVFQNKTTWFPTMVIDYNTYTGDLKFDGKRFWWYQNKYYKLELDKHSTYSKN